MEINKENIEELILLFTDGEMTGKEAGQLMDFIRQRPEYDSLLKSYAATRLTPEDGLTFPDKALLMREENTIIPFYQRAGFIVRVAAILVLGISGITLLWKQDERPEQLRQVAVRQAQPAAGRQREPERPAEKRAAQDQVAVTPGPVSRPKNTHTVVRPPRQAQTVKRETAYDAPAEQSEVSEQGIARPVLVPESIASSVEQKVKQPGLLPGDSLEPASMAKAVNKESLSIPDWMPLDQDRLRGINDLVGQIRATREKVEERVAILKHSTLVLQVWNKEITVGNRKE